jgi:cbb3-type cytochrome oxidase subunit 3
VGVIWRKLRKQKKKEAKEACVSNEKFARLN